jgi:hypothetical protein
MEINNDGWLNISLVFLMAVAYSSVELLSIFNTARSLFKSYWGISYLLINGFLAIIALVLTFKSEMNQHFLGPKILVSGTSALALLRVIVVPIKQNGVGNNVMPMIDIILNHVKVEYDRDRSKFDLSDIKPIMKGIDYKKAAEALPVLCSNLLQTISEEEGKKMNEEIQKLLTLEEGSKDIKAINLGAILARYIGIKLLKSTVNEIREFISTNLDESRTDQNDPETNELDLLIEKFS